MPIISNTKCYIQPNQSPSSLSFDDAKIFVPAFRFFKYQEDTNKNYNSITNHQSIRNINPKINKFNQKSIFSEQTSSKITQNQSLKHHSRQNKSDRAIINKLNLILNLQQLQNQGVLYQNFQKQPKNEFSYIKNMIEKRNQQSQQYIFKYKLKQVQQVKPKTQKTRPSSSSNLSKFASRSYSAYRTKSQIKSCSNILKNQMKQSLNSISVLQPETFLTVKSYKNNKSFRQNKTLQYTQNCSQNKLKNIKDNKNNPFKQFVKNGSQKQLICNNSQKQLIKRRTRTMSDLNEIKGWNYGQEMDVSNFTDYLKIDRIRYKKGKKHIKQRHFKSQTG